MKVIIRGTARGAMVFEDNVEVTEQNLDVLVGEMIAQHAKALADHAIHMIEFEFPELPEEERFFRIGTDPRAMVMPLVLDLRKARKAREN